jgi:hypothetical protein
MRLLVAHYQKRLKLQLVSKRRSGWWSNSPQGALGTGRHSVKAGLKAEAGILKIGKTTGYERKSNLRAGKHVNDRRATV